MGNSQDKPPLRKALSVPDTHTLSPDTPVLYKEKSRSSQRLYQPNKGGNGKQSKSKIKKSKQQKEPQPEFQLPPSEAAFLPAFPLRGDLEDLDFEVIEVIAKGAYGNVIKVQREDDKRFYATKILSKAQILQEGAVRQCKDEASIQSMAGQHPFVVKAYEYWQSQSSLYLVLEYIPHGDMFTLWTFHGAFPEDLVRLYIAEMSLVLDYLHSECVIYRDIKMENILFDAMGHIQLTDFGLAKWLQSGDNTRTVCGTLQYMAPEVLSVYPYGHPADWWSVGILMYTMLAGRYPVDGMDTHTRMAQRVFECDYLLPSNISDSAQDVINRILTKSPHKRLCDLYHLQDLHFFQDLIFSDLTDGKINPVEVVPPDFFPMTGASWAPYVFEEENNKQFEEFDGTNPGYTDDYVSDENQQQEQYPSHVSPSTHNNHGHDQCRPPRAQRQRSTQQGTLSNSYDRHPQSQEAMPSAYPDDTTNNYDGYPRSRDAPTNAYPDQQTNSYDRYPQPQDAYSDKQTNSHIRPSNLPEASNNAFPDNEIRSYDRSPKHPEASARAYPQPTIRPSVSIHNDKEKQIVTSSDSSNMNRSAMYPVESYNGEPRRRDRIESASSLSGSGQIPSSSVGYPQDLPNITSYQSQSHSTYSNSSTHQNRDYTSSDYNDSRYESGQRRGSRDSFLTAMSRENSLHSSPLHHSSQPPALPQNPPPPTLTSQQPFTSPSRDSSTFKLMEPAPTVTLGPKNTNTGYKMNNNFMQDAYNLNNQMGPRVVPQPSLATVVTAPTAKLPPNDRISGYGQLEEAKIELPTSPVVKSPPSMSVSQPNQFVPPSFNQIRGPVSLNRFQPPQPPPQSTKPRHALATMQFQLQQPSSRPLVSSSPQVIPPQPPPQASKPTVHSKPSVAPKPKSNAATTKPNVLAPVPAVRKSFNTKKSHKPQKTEPSFEENLQAVLQPHSLQSANTIFNDVKSSGANVNHPYNSNPPSNSLGIAQGGYVPQANPRPVPRPRPRQNVLSNPGEANSQPQQMGGPERVDYDNDESGQQSPGSYQWNLPTSVVPHFV